MRFLLAATLAAGSFAGAAQAATLDAGTLLGQFNTIVLGNLTAQSETEGTVFVGGDLNSNGYTVSPDTEPQVTLGGSTGALFVGGNLNGNPVNVNAGGNTVIGGARNAIVNSNGGGTVTTGASVPVSDVADAMLGLSASLAALAATPGSGTDVSDFNSHKIVAGSGGTGALDGIAIIEADASFFSGNGFGGILGNPLLTAIVNVSGTSITFGNAFNANGTLPNLIFNFYEATSITINTALSFSILAPKAQVNLGGGGINGTLVAGSLNQMAEIRTTFAGDTPPPSAVPLPAAGWLVAAGMASLAALRRRRTSPAPL